MTLLDEGDQRLREVHSVTAMEGSERKPQDAGLRSLDHYKHRLPRWRFILRESFIPVVRWETPYVARFQERLRSPALDAYFAFAANLGTHTFFMIILPILFWCGRAKLGRSMTHVLASGVFFSGFIKDLLCLPRPLSPPLQRISRSASAALEYGFPSTHSTNAVSVAICAIYHLRSSPSFTPSLWNHAVQAIFVFYAVSIVIGRVYCGMHGFFDVVVGTTLGAFLAFIQCATHELFDAWILEGTLKNLVIVTLFVLALVRIHPEPADDCPCFDDSLAFSGVMIGIQLGGWHYALSGFAENHPVPSTTPFSIQELGWIKVILRTFLGVVVIFAWRAIAKPCLLKVLPPIFRIGEILRLTLPRKFFLRASQYQSVPPLKKDDGVIPPASEIPAMITSLRHPRKRAISVGPQSQADAYETIAFRERIRRQSSSSMMSQGPPSPSLRRDTGDASPVANSHGPRRSISVTFPQSRKANFQDADLRDSPVVLSPREDLDGEYFATSTGGANGGAEADDEAMDREMFSKLLVPRVRYDVEVVTKLIVYSGIAWFAVEGNPILFELCGLGLGVRPL